MIPKLNDAVTCPPDRGDKGYRGTVVHVDRSVETNLSGIPFVWTTVQQSSGSKHVWPSHRIGYSLSETDILALTAPALAASPVAAAVPAPSSAPSPAPAPTASPAPARRRRP